MRCGDDRQTASRIGFRTYLGILGLARNYGAPRLEAACARGVSIRARSVSFTPPAVAARANADSRSAHAPGQLLHPLPQSSLVVADGLVAMHRAIKPHRRAAPAFAHPVAILKPPDDLPPPARLIDVIPRGVSDRISLASLTPFRFASCQTRNFSK